MAKTNAELQTLEEAQSRNEQFLDYLCGRATDINALPIPESRVEELLEFLCYNGGIGGGGGANPLVALTNAVINNNIITFQKSDGATVQVDLNELNTRINNIVPTQGNINLELRQVGDSIRLQVEGQDAGVIDLAGFVKSVNNIAPVVGANGNITLNAEHMNYDDANTQLGVRTVQEAIEKLKEDMGLIDGAEIHIVADKNELDGLVVAGTLNKGDIIYVIDSTDVVDYDNVNVDNGNNPISMIYDDGVAGNHLRVFSKVAPTINLNASNVAFNSNNVDGVTANNVQTVIEQVNTTARNSYATSTYDAQTGKLTLTKHNGTSNEYDLATGTVKTVNQQPSDGQGNVKVDAEHIEYNNQTSQLTSQNVQEAIDYLEGDKASLNKNNVFIGHNTFNEVNLLGKTPFVETGGANSSSFSAVGKYCGYRSVSTHRSTTTPQPVYVSAVKIEVADNLDVEDVVTGVYVVEVQKKANKVNDIVGEKFAENSSFIVEEDSSGRKVIYVPIEKTYTDDTYFLIGKNGRQEFKETFYSDPNDVATNSINGLDINSLSSKGDELAHDKGIGWVTRHALTNGTVDVREELEALNNKIINSGTISSVNGQQPTNGNVTIDGTHINATVGNDNRSIQDHLTTIGNGLTTVNTRSITNDNRLTKLENKVPNIQVGDIISTYNTTMGDVYTAGNATFLYCGRDMAVSVNTYPQLATALGITATGNFKFPVVQDITHKYDNGARDARRRHYICAKITY